MATKNNTVSNASKDKDKSNKASAKPHNQNPLISILPIDTIDSVIGALDWLNAADGAIENTVGGAPSDSMKFGRYLLGICCTDALKAAGYEIGREREAAKAKAE